MAKIEVIADALINAFDPKEGIPYCYDNFRSKDEKQQALVNECIDKMIEAENPLVFDFSYIVNSQYKPVKTDVELVIDTINLTLEKKQNA